MFIDFCINLIGIFDLIDISPQDLEPTWTNNRSGLEGIQKRLDIFVVKSSPLQCFHRYKTWVGKNKLSDHWSIFLQIDGTPLSIVSLLDLTTLF